MKLTERVLPSFEYLDSILKYDPLSGDLIWRKNRGQKVKSGGNAGHLRPDGYIAVTLWIDGLRTEIRAHRIAWFLHHRKWPNVDETIDHVNGIKSDNRLENLRIASQSQNSQNSRKRVDNTSGVKDIYWRKCRERWVVRVMSNNIRFYGGSFADKADAVNARNRLLNKLHGQFARPA